MGLPFAELAQPGDARKQSARPPRLYDEESKIFSAGCMPLRAPRIALRDLRGAGTPSPGGVNGTTRRALGYRS